MLGLSHPDISLALLQPDIASGMHLAFTNIEKFKFMNKFKRRKNKDGIIQCLFESMSFQSHIVIDIGLYSLRHIKNLWFREKLDFGVLLEHPGGRSILEDPHGIFGAPMLGSDGN